MTPEEYRELDLRMKDLDDAALRRLVYVDFAQYQPIAVELARDELRCRSLPLLSPKEYWEQFPEEWLSGIGFCYRCWEETTDESPEHPWHIFGMGMTLLGRDAPCPECGSAIEQMWFCLFLPIIPLDQYRVVKVDRFERKGRKLRNHEDAR